MGLLLITGRLQPVSDLIEPAAPIPRSSATKTNAFRVILRIVLSFLRFDCVKDLRTVPSLSASPRSGYFLYIDLQLGPHLLSLRMEKMAIDHGIESD